MKDPFFNDDPFESIINDFFGQRRTRRTTNPNQEYEDNDSSFIVTKDNVFLTLELSGFKEEDIDLKIKENIVEIKAKKDSLEGVKDYLIKRLEKGMIIRKDIPEEAKVKNFEWTLKNGILEIKFEKR